MGDLKKLGKYTIQSVLGQGAMGVVYKGFDPNIERTVAIKTIRKEALNKEERQTLLARFKQEAQAAGRLTHPNIVTVYDYDEDGDNAFIAMEYVPGRELQDFLDNQERFSLNTVINIVTQLLNALIYSHAQGVIHRDIKPANILVLTTGQIKVMDFGIAKIESSTLTQFGDVFGTPSYMSPEQCAGKAADKRSDLYSAGVILYRLITGEKLFHGDSMTSIIHQVMTTEPPLVSKFNSQAPPLLDQVVRKALAKKPAQRFQTADEFKAALTAGTLTGELLAAELSGKNVTELREMCATAGITGTSKKNKKQLLEVLQDVGRDGSRGLKTNLPSAEIASASQRLDAAAKRAKQKKYDKTVVEQVAAGSSKKTKKLPLRKKLKRGLTILLVIILAIFGFAGWTIYVQNLSFQEVIQIAREIKNDPEAAAVQYLKIAKEQAIAVAVSAYDQFIAFAKEKYKEVSAASSGPKSAAPETSHPPKDK